MSKGKRRFKRSAGMLTYNAEHNFYHGRVDGKKVTMNRGPDKDGKEVWFINEEIDVFEVEIKESQNAPSFNDEDIPF